MQSVSSNAVAQALGTFFNRSGDQSYTIPIPDGIAPQYFGGFVCGLANGVGAFAFSFIVSNGNVTKSGQGDGRINISVSISNATITFTNTANYELRLSGFFH